MSEIDYASPQFIDQQRQLLAAYFKEFPFFKLMGFELQSVEPGKARLGMSWREDLCQPAGVMHGGALASLIDTAIAHAILLTPQGMAARNAGGGMVSVDLRVKYLRPVSTGQIYCDARITRPGRQLIHTAAEVFDAEGKEVAHGDSIYMIISGKQLKKRAE